MKKAFTLLELLIVLVIVAILAVLALPQYELFLIRARGAEAMRNLQALSDSIWRYYLQNGHFPPTEEVSTELFRLPPYKGGALWREKPRGIDVEIQGRYFSYTYFAPGPEEPPGCGAVREFRAWDTEAVFFGPIGAITAYGIGYINLGDNPPADLQAHRQKMEAPWYKYRYYYYKDSERYDNRRWGWPGEE